MEIEITPEQEAQLVQIAAHLHKAPHQLVIDAALRLIDEDDRFRAGVRKGIEEANRGEVIDEAEMNVQIERMLTNDLENNLRLSPPPKSPDRTPSVCGHSRAKPFSVARPSRA
jgi:predicted transcriptional regulator